MSTKISPNQREVIGAISTVTGRYEALNSTNGALNTTGGGGGGGTQYVEGVTTAPATGTAFLARYKTTPPSLTDGQLYTPQLDSAGNLKVTGSLSVGGTTDNSAFTAGTSTGTPTMGFYHSTIDTVTDGCSAAVGITPKRAMLVNLQTAAGVETGIAAVPLQVSLANTGANTSKLLVTPDSVALPANQSVNMSQINGVTPLMGNGVTGTGAQRVTIASDNTPFAIKVDQTTPGTTNAMSVSQIGATTVATGNGVVSAGVQRVAIASDNTAFSVNATPTAPTTIFNGKTTVTTAGTRVTLAASQAVKSVVIKALAANTGTIYVGNATVASTNGFALAAGDTMSLDIANLNTVNLDASVSGEGVTYVGTN